MRERRSFMGKGIGNRGLEEEGYDFLVSEEGGVLGSAGEELASDGVIEVTLPIIVHLGSGLYDLGWSDRGGWKGEEDGEGGKGCSGDADKGFWSEERFPPGGLWCGIFQTDSAKGVLHKTRGRMVGGGVSEKIPNCVLFKVGVEIGEIVIWMAGRHGFFGH
jgi:hypothetical protein